MEKSDLTNSSFITISLGILMVLVFVMFPLNSCKTAENPSLEEVWDENSRCPAGQWGIDTSNYYAYRHDCLPYQSAHFTVYSDGSSWEAKQQLAEIAEEAFAQLVPEFSINSIENELQFTEGYTYYIYAEKYIDYVAMGFRNGFYIAAIDNAIMPDVYTRDPANYRYVVKHELTHVFQFTLTDCPSNEACPYWLGVWFREGQAIIMGGGQHMMVSTLGEFHEWINDPDHVNPISIHRSTDFPDQGGGYYPMFALAYYYLTDIEYGHGSTIRDMRNLFQFMAEGDGFHEAFERALNISVEYFHDNFYSLMENYLEQIENNTGNTLSEKINYFNDLCYHFHK